MNNCNEQNEAQPTPARCRRDHRTPRVVKGKTIHHGFHGWHGWKNFHFLSVLSVKSVVEFLRVRLAAFGALRLNCLLVLAAFVAFPAGAQIQQAWVARYNNGIPSGAHQAVAMTLDSAGNIYVTGSSQNTNGNPGYVTIKYAPNGNQLWAARYDATPAAPSSLVLDNSNNVIITGNALTIKYNVNGSQLWTAPYAGAALAVDPNGNVAVTGFGTNFNTVKLNSSGIKLWQDTYPPAYATDVDVGQAVVADTNGNIFVAGNYITDRLGNNGDYVFYELLAIKFSPNGSNVWTGSYQQGGAPAQVTGMALDVEGNITMAVNIIDDPGGLYNVVRFDSNGKLAWATSFTDGYEDDSVNGLALNKSGAILVTGAILYRDASAFSFATFEIGTNAAEIWTDNYPSVSSATSVATAITADSANNSYVTGYSSGANSSNDIVTIAYGPNGNQLWLQRYHGPGSGNDAGNAIAVDNNGNVYVTGYEATVAGGTEMVTIKYSPLILQKQANGSVLLEAQGSPGESFNIQATADLIHWLNLGTAITDTNGLMQFADTNAANLPARFYITNPQ